MTPVQVYCPGDSVYDYEQGECLPEESAKCYDLCDECEIYCAQEGRVPDPEDCKSYYYCVPPNQLAHFHCTDYEIFDKFTNTCVNGTICAPACPESPTSDAPEDGDFEETDLLGLYDGKDPFSFYSFFGDKDESAEEEE